MNQTTINITARQDLAQVSLRKKVGEMVQGVNKWLDAKSGFYSRICGFSVTRRVVARVNTVTLSLMAGGGRGAGATGEPHGNGRGWMDGLESKPG